MPIATRDSAFGAAALAVALLAVVTGCSSGSGSRDTDSDSKLLQGLGTLAEDNRTEQVIYLDVGKTRQLSKGDPKRFAVIGLPGSSLVDSPMPAPWGRHLNVSQIDTAVDTPKAGHWEGSFDAAAIAKALKSNGYRQREEDGTQVWKHPDTSEATFEISQDEISYSALDAKPMSAVSPKEGASLADNQDYQRAAECLGDVYRADFAPFVSAKPVRLSVLGQRATSASKNTEIFCFLTKDEVTADRLAAKLRSVVHAKSPDYDGTKVTVEKNDGPFVRAIVPDSASQPPGRLLRTDVDLWLALHDL